VVDLATNYLGLSLSNPIIVGSSGLTASVDGAKRIEEAGAGAVVLKSIFEEQIERELAHLVEESDASLWHPEAAAYISSYGKENAVKTYLDLISDVKKSVSIPVIASVHCATVGAWTEFARRAENVGADALELNAFVLPADPRRTGKDNEKFYFDVVTAVKKQIAIPLSIKLGPYFSGLVDTLVALSQTDLGGMVLFNRFYNLDIDIDKQRLVPARPFSHPDEYIAALRWISILSGRVSCDLAASTGIHDGNAAIKQLLAGAAAVQMVSSLYENNLTRISEVLDTVTAWMTDKGYERIADFKGKLSQSESENPAEYLRVQFMKYSVSQG
jgi:dihydroorotate dehydrogenase (fumarate)